MMKKQFLLAAICSVAFALSGCGGGDDTPSRQAANDLSVDINASTGANAVGAVTNGTFTFPNGVPDFGTTASTNVTLTSDGFIRPSGAADPGFTVTSGGQTASGSLEFGSCIFNVTQSNFTTGLLRPGARIVVNPCQLLVNTQGEPADNVARARSVFLILRAVRSAALSFQVSVSEGGQVTVNAHILGTVIVIDISGGGSL